MHGGGIVDKTGTGNGQPTLRSRCMDVCAERGRDDGRCSRGPVICFPLVRATLEGKKLGLELVHWREWQDQEDQETQGRGVIKLCKVGWRLSVLRARAVGLVLASRSIRRSP